VSAQRLAQRIVGVALFSETTHKPGMPSVGFCLDVRGVWVAFVVVAVAACEMPTPQAPAEPIGTPPPWGEGFVLPKEQPASALGMPATASAPSPGNTGEWTGGDPTLGKGVYVALCARCHGDAGEGAMVPGVGMATALSESAFQTRMSDKDMARSIALGKGAMPSFMKDLDKPKLAGVIAYIRTLKK
jgi:mono/diheme cytochrome c family protein